MKKSSSIWTAAFLITSIAMAGPVAPPPSSGTPLKLSKPVTTISATMNASLPVFEIMGGYNGALISKCAANGQFSGNGTDNGTEVCIIVGFKSVQAENKAREFLSIPNRINGHLIGTAVIQSVEYQ